MTTAAPTTAERTCRVRGTCADVLAGTATHAVECRDAEALTALLPDACVDLLLTDPPYRNVVGEAWDRQWRTDADYLAWLGGLCDGWRRVLKPNGSLYVFASPDMAGRVECVVRERFNVLNVIRWTKDAGWHQKTDEEQLRSFLSPWEAIIVAEQGNDGVCEPIRAYLEAERLRAGITFEQVREMVGCAPGSGLPSHWFTRSQWLLPTESQYAKLQTGFNRLGGRLERHYEYLRREYEELRRPFHATDERPYTDVWDFPTVPAYPGKHPCEKPQSLLQHVILTSSRPDAVVLDCFCGSGSTGEAALSLSRRCLLGDASEHWAQYAAARLTREFGALPQTSGRTTKRRKAGGLDLFADQVYAPNLHSEGTP